MRVNDRDHGARKSIVWLAAIDSYTNPDSVQRIVLADKASPPARVNAAGEYDRDVAHAQVHVSAMPELAPLAGSSYSPAT